MFVKFSHFWDQMASQFFSDSKTNSKGMNKMNANLNFFIIRNNGESKFNDIN